MQPGSIDFEEMNWYETMMFYGYQESEDGVSICSPSVDADHKLMPSLVEKVLLPKLIGAHLNILCLTNKLSYVLNQQ